MRGSANESQCGRATQRAHADRPTQINPTQILHMCCREWCIDLAEFCGDSQHERVVRARHAYALLARGYTVHSYPEIARSVNRNYHSTVITWRNAAVKRLAGDELLRDMVLTGVAAIINHGFGSSKGCEHEHELCRVVYRDGRKMRRFAP